MAGFALSINGGIWVSTEVAAHHIVRVRVREFHRSEEFTFEWRGLLDEREGVLLPSSRENTYSLAKR